MAFLDNSGDIILDAVLTDTGRMRLARGDGSFRITKFAFGDDEINYGSYDKTHTSGSAYYDLTILQTPILEAFTNNTSTMKSKLMSIARQDHLYLPSLRINTAIHGSRVTVESDSPLTSAADGGVYLLTADNATSTAFNNTQVGVVHGDPTKAATTHPITIDQGLVTTEIAPSEEGLGMGNPLRETQYIIEVDDRFIKVANPTGQAALASVSFVDDDRIASYALSEVADDEHFSEIGWDANNNTNDSSPITGPAGSRLMFKLRASTEVQNSNHYFTKFGGTTTIPAGMLTANLADAHYYIDTTVRITGFTTGNRIDIPVRLIKAGA